MTALQAFLPPAPACASCVHFEAERTDEGACRRHAPIANPIDGSAAWPIVRAADRCGEYTLDTDRWLGEDRA